MASYSFIWRMGCSLKFHRLKLNLRVSSRTYKTEAAVFGHNPLLIRDQPVTDLDRITKETLPVHCLINGYREYGHLQSRVNPLGQSSKLDISSCQWILNPESYSLNMSDTVTNPPPVYSHIISNEVTTVSDLVDKLKHIYCDKLTVEVAHMVDSAEKDWFCKQYEELHQSELMPEHRQQNAILMKKSQVFEQILASKFTTLKRYGGDGCESLIALYNEIFRESATGGVDKIVVCSAHRGRLNLLTTFLGLSPAQVFRKVQGHREWPENVKGCGDVLSHLSSGKTLEYADGEVYVTMIPNPSHLEACNPVAAGKTRAKQRLAMDGDYSTHPHDTQTHRALCLQIHGDAAFAGQGVIQETLALSGVPHFNVGGSIHVVINNQLGFTTEAERGRTSLYSSCVTKMNSVPVIRVNGEDADSMIKAAALAVRYRNTWHKDVIIDVMCYRRLGHNELDDPSFTQPIMYRVIKDKMPVPDTYLSQLIEEGVCKEEDMNGKISGWHTYLQQQFETSKEAVIEADHLEKQWSGMTQASSTVTTWDTGVDEQLLRFVSAKSVDVPADFTAHPTLNRSHIQRRIEKTQQNSPIDWATAEAMAFGSLLIQGYDVRISGQDVGRGTFSHRHIMLVDQETDAIHIPLNHMYDEQTNFLEVGNSILSEEAVLGFEYGFSIESPRCLAIWEAQFGDFFNGAQIMIDTYISSGEAKWLRQTGLVMLLPTGMDGAGPEHSSCRLERFLQLTDSKEEETDGDDVNMYVAHPTTPSQYFHLLRRQMLRNFRKPLIVGSPKTLLRLPAAVSTLPDMAPGTHFHPVLDDSVVNKSKVSKVVFCSGKHFYTLAEERDKRKATDVALVRLEELCPFPTQSLQHVTKSYPSAKQFIWSQEEHRNYGSWSFVRPRFENLVGVKLGYAGRAELAAPACGMGIVHKTECANILESTFNS
ncbi:DHTKD1 [Bugula neritina]|uniref:DHTKD1 n=1 Tax=Bugula neritina TaxID=10212 RepID=A0A7J7KNA2_BUGNE|nr:DHTKD1 [Bugula neritina]